MRNGSKVLWPVVLGMILALSLAAGCSQESGTRDTGDEGEEQQQGLQIDIVDQWLESAHARPVTRAATEEGCKNCHDGETFTETGGGFMPRIEPGAASGESTGTTDSTGTGSGTTTGTVSADEQEPRDWVVAMDCRVCHTGAGVDIAEEGSVEQIPNLETAEGGQGALCMACHNGWHQAGVGREGNAAAPHYSVQTDMLFGVNTMPVAGSQDATGTQDGTGTEGGDATAAEDEGVSPHAEVRDTCVGCHVSGGDSPNHTFAIEGAEGCERSGCHEDDMTDGGDAEEDFDGDGNNEKVTAEVEGLMESLKQAIIQSAGITDFKSERGDVVFDGGTVNVNSPEYAAAYNYIYVEKDGSNGIHNTKFTVKLLQDSIASLR